MTEQLEVTLTNLSEAGRLSEADGPGRVRVRIIETGWGSSGYYSSEMLERDGPNVFTAGTQMYIDHPSMSEEFERPERSIRDLAGHLATDARFENGALVAEAEIISAWRPVITELWEHIGVSIRARGEVDNEAEIDGQRGPVIRAITEAASVDFVTKPGAGGRVTELLESNRKQSQLEGLDMDKEQELREARNQIQTLESERNTALTERDTAISERDTLQETVNTLTSERDQLREQAVTHQAREIISEAVNKNEQLPAAARKRVVNTVMATVPKTDSGELDRTALDTKVTEAVEAEVAYLSEVTGYDSTRVRDLGTPGGNDDVDLSAAFQELGLSESAAKVAAQGRR
jgi:hypothetical protein